NDDEEEEKKEANKISKDMYYNYEEICSRPFTTPSSNIPENLLHSFGYDCRHRANLQVLDEHMLAFGAGNFLVLLNIHSKEQRYIQSCSNGGIGAIMVHPSKHYLAVAEKGSQPKIIVYEYPTLKPYRVLRGGTAEAYSCLDFNIEGNLLASVGSAPDFMLTLWKWRKEQVILSCKAYSQDIYRVTFSPYDSGQLTTSGSGHIKFWKMASTFTGLKLQGELGRFGKTTLTDIEGYVELPYGKVVSGSEWGNMLLWDGGLIKVEICLKGGKTCHTGTIKQFALDEGELLTIGADGAVMSWDFETIDTADCKDDSGLFEMEPMNRVVIGRNVSLVSVVKSPVPESSIWFAQDSNGGIWKLDLSFTNITHDPECLFNFHAGAIQGMDVSGSSHLMATTALDRTVRIFDFVAKKELTKASYKQGGTTLRWAPHMVSEVYLLSVGFEDGVVRLLEICNPNGVRVVAGHSDSTATELHLKQAFKPHNGQVTAIAFERNGNIMASGSADCTVFFFSVGECYEPIGFITVPGCVCGLEWSPQSHEQSTLLIMCETGHVLEVPAPDLEQHRQDTGSTYRLQGLPTRYYRFSSIKSQIKRDAEVARRQACKEKKREEQLKKLKDLGKVPLELQEEEEEEDKEELPPLYNPDPPSPLFCGFYSQPGCFWLSMGGYDSGFLYHCEFSKQQSEDPLKRKDHPFAFLPIQGADDPICTIGFNRQLMLCGMWSGGIRAYPLELNDQDLTSMQDYWALSVHDNQYGHVQQVRWSFDDQFVLTAGQDGNIFSFTLHTGVNELNRAKVPSLRDRTELEKVAQDIEDPSGYSIEMAKQKLEQDRALREAEQRKAGRRRRLATLRGHFQLLLEKNESLPPHAKLHPSAERQTAQRIKEVRRELAWVEEKHRIGLKKLQQRYSHNNTEIGVHTVPVIVPYFYLGDSPDLAMLQPCVAQPGMSKLAGRQAEKHRRAAEKAEKARAKIQKRKKEWADLYNSKPNLNYEDPEDVQAIHLATENMGDFKLKTAKDFTVPEHLRMNAEKKKVQLSTLEEKKLEMNTRVLTLRDSKVLVLSELHSQLQRLQEVQEHLAPHQRCLLPTLPALLPEEMPERKLRYNRSTLQRYGALKAIRTQVRGQEEDKWAKDLLDELWGEEETQPYTPTPTLTPSPSTHTDTEQANSELEEEMRRVEEIKALHLQDTLIKQMEEAVCYFDAELCLLRHDKLWLDVQMKLADLRHITLFQEWLLLKDFEKRENTLQERLSSRLQEQTDIRQQLELKRSDIAKLQEKEKAIVSAFHASLGENNKFADFLNKVFKKKITRAKKEKTADAGQDSNEDSDEDSSWDEGEDEEDSQSEAALDMSVCPPNCDPELFENAVQLRERHLDIEDQLAEEKKSAENLKKECDSLTKKDKVLQSSLKAAEGDLELFNREKQQKLNELDMVVPLRLHQIQLVSSGVLQSNLSAALVLNASVLSSLQKRIEELVLESSEQRDLYRQAKQRHITLTHEHKDMEAKIQELDTHCDQLMMMKFGKLVDLEALLTLSGSSTLEEERRQETLIQERAHIQDLTAWEAVLEVTQQHTERLWLVNDLLTEQRVLEDKLDRNQRKMGTRIQGQRCGDDEELQRLKELVKTQAQEARALREEIRLFAHKGVHIQPPPNTLLSPRTSSNHPHKLGKGHPSCRKSTDY
uniref:Cilia- and flagella-associated protein 44 n=1 Tax=Denticeps clupeoides TaxID=299321 RepID=A0AAY4ATV8_9TELE